MYALANMRTLLAFESTTTTYGSKYQFILIMRQQVCVCVSSGSCIQVDSNSAPDIPWWLCESLQKHNLAVTRRPNFLGEKCATAAPCAFDTLCTGSEMSTA